MTDIAIRVEGLGKKYRLGANAQPYKTLRESLVNLAALPVQTAARLARRPAADKRGHRPEIWALKDVSFDVKHGEVLGIIGPNGAGKSTLLKLLSQITEPTEGRIRINGRVASLLEVGTGFHPELTGRENVFLNGAILGMSRAEIQRKFDEIVAFAEVEKFIDTQVKHYSSGMYLRLAFAVAAHLEPEILVVDEVLAVGDAQFQKRCLGKMQDVSREGRTVLYVSHDLGAVRSLCPRCVLLHQGMLSFDSDTFSVLRRYAQQASKVPSQATVYVQDKDRIKGTREVKIERLSMMDVEGHATVDFSIWEPMQLEMVLNAEDDRQRTVSCWVLFANVLGDVIMSGFQYDMHGTLTMRQERVKVIATIDNILSPGEYLVSVGVFGHNNDFHDWCHSVLRFKVNREFYKHTRSFDNRLGHVTVKSNWKFEKLPC